MAKKYSIEIDQINLFDQRFYKVKIGNKEYDLFSVTSWLDAFPKGEAYKNWLKNTKDPEELREEAAQLGSISHQAIEATLKGHKVRFEDLGNDLDAWERFLCFGNFYADLMTNPSKTLGIKGIKSVTFQSNMVEIIVYDLDLKTAGTVDAVIGIELEDGKMIYGVLDWKTGGNIYPTAEIQAATYIYMFKKLYKVDECLGFIIHLNPKLNKNGYRVKQIEDPEYELKMFRATQELYRRAFGEPTPKYRTYPLEVELNTIKKVEMK